MAHVTVTLPRLLAKAAAGQRHLDVDAATCGGALEAVLADHPGLRVHLFDGDGSLRRNVLVFVDGEQTRLDGDDPAVREGGEVTVLQSVAGG